ncbi:MAG: taurine dioxygenase [Alphaproteobacteria bacterium]|nr:taurine dioxygenase [Alphaproteobacteria bacterium]|tara:strand:- start:2619 stop:3470 length:852 start_codon:yes stop_codon:yes gene_type:complete
MTLVIAPTDAALGAVATGIDLGRSVEDAVAAEVRMALCQHGVLAFPDQDMAPQAQVALTRQLGEPEAHVLSDFALEDMPEVFIVSNVRKDGKPVGAINAGQYWHSDLSYTARPTFASMLHAKEVPPGRGETLFASMVRAYETLSDEIKVRIDGCHAVHDYTLAYETVFADNPDRTLTAEQAAEVPPVEHPVVRTQVETGRKAIYVNPGFTRRIVEMDADESRETLETLFAQATDPSNIYTHHWQVGDFLMWDNRITMHMALSNYAANDVRHLLRTSVTGETPV